MQTTQRTMNRLNTDSVQLDPIPAIFSHSRAAGTRVIIVNLGICILTQLIEIASENVIRRQFDIIWYILTCAAAYIYSIFQHSKRLQLLCRLKKVSSFSPRAPSLQRRRNQSLKTAKNHEIFCSQLLPVIISSFSARAPFLLTKLDHLTAVFTAGQYRARYKSDV